MKSGRHQGAPPDRPEILFSETCNYRCLLKTRDRNTVEVYTPNRSGYPCVVVTRDFPYFAAPKDAAVAPELEAFATKSSLPSKMIDLVNHVLRTEIRYRPPRESLYLRFGLRALSEEGFFDRIRHDPRLPSHQWERQSIPPHVARILTELADEQLVNAIGRVLTDMSLTAKPVDAAASLAKLAERSHLADVLVRVIVQTARADRAALFVNASTMSTPYAIASCIRTPEDPKTFRPVTETVRSDKLKAEGIILPKSRESGALDSWQRRLGDAKVVFPEYAPGAWYLLAAAGGRLKGAGFEVRHSDSLATAIVTAGGKAIVASSVKSHLDWAEQQYRVRSAVADKLGANAAERVSILPILEHHVEVWSRDRLGFFAREEGTGRPTLLNLPHHPERKFDAREQTEQLFRLHLANLTEARIVTLPFHTQGGNVVPTSAGKVVVCDKILARNPHVTKADIEAVHRLVGFGDTIWIPPTDDDPAHSDTSVFERNGRALVPQMRVESLELFRAASNSSRDIELLQRFGAAFDTVATIMSEHAEVRRIPIPLISTDPTVEGRLSPANAQIVTDDAGVHRAVIAWAEAQGDTRALDLSRHADYRAEIEEAYRWCGIREVLFVEMDASGRGGAHCAINALPEELGARLFQNSMHAWP